MNPNVSFDRIEQIYAQLGYQMNWGFLTCPVRNFENPTALFVGLNPGGGRPEEEADRNWSRQKDFSRESGNDYLVGKWEDFPLGQAPLQLQVQSLCKFIDVPIQQLASANFVPFQSPTWAALKRKEEALAFARELWCDLIDGITPRYVISLGQVVGAELRNLFGVGEMSEIPTGWGATKVRFGDTSSGGRLVILPHLSRYKLFNRDGSENRYSPPLRKAFGLTSDA
jgi:hypothetical protein